jgi:hypothetical protein
MIIETRNLYHSFIHFYFQLAKIQLFILFCILMGLMLKVRGKFNLYYAQNETVPFHLGHMNVATLHSAI